MMRSRLTPDLAAACEECSIFDSASVKCSQY